MLERPVVMLAAVLLLAGCGGKTPEVPGNAAKKPDTNNIEVHGDSSGEVNKLAVEAIADLQDFWAKQFPDLYGKDYEPRCRRAPTSPRAR
jgi:predicted metalloprotease